jgi:hypothetical protein
VAEHFHKRTLPGGIGALVRTRLKRVGDHCLSFYGRGSEREAAGADDPGAAEAERDTESGEGETE